MDCVMYVCIVVIDRNYCVAVIVAQGYIKSCELVD